ncbi:hypothetical protein [Richelia sinica]|uniref:hypothetical protein n=1 Tax=Richelia sinica TaxID=1357545 RepID=UPI0016859391|nr:hypothetical protein [Richelia sinica]MBD2666699.1 hypothetical protein [Richelia sinica FACHB-800]
MATSKLIGAVGVAVALLSTFPFPSLAQIPYQGQSVYKVSINGDTVVYVNGTPSGSAEVQLGFVDKISSKIAGSCGEIKLSSSSLGSTPSIQVNSSNVTLSSLPIQLLPSCTNGSFVEARTQNFRSPSGDVIIVGQVPASAVLINIPKNTNKTVRLNACGFGTLKNSSSFSIPSAFTIGNNSYSLSSLPSPTDPPVCRGGIKYQPTAWGS